MSKPTKNAPQNNLLPSAIPALSFSLDGKSQLRVVMQEADPWFVAADVAQSLGYRMASDMTRSLEDDEKGTHIVRTPSGSQEMILINESGLYLAIIKSRKPEARRFRRWVTHEVLPSIRRTGSYSTTHQVSRERQIGRCQTLIRDIERSKSKFCRDGLLALAGLAFADVGLPMPDLKGLHPLQLPLVPEGGAA